MRRTIWSLALMLWLGHGGAALGAAYDDFLNAVKNGNAREVAQWLNRGVDANTVDPAGQTVLHLAARAGALDVVRVLVDTRANIDRRNANGETAIMLAALGGHRSVVEFLISKEAQINQPGWTALLYAATNGHLEIIKILIENHAYIDSSPDNGLTSLMMAARGGHMSVVRFLLEEGADASLKNDRGESALDWALQTRNTDIAALIAAKLKK